MVIGGPCSLSPQYNEGAIEVSCPQSLSYSSQESGSWSSMCQFLRPLSSSCLLDFRVKIHLVVIFFSRFRLSSNSQLRICLCCPAHALQPRIPRSPLQEPNTTRDLHGIIHGTSMSNCQCCWVSWSCIIQVKFRNRLVARQNSAATPTDSFDHDH